MQQLLNELVIHLQQLNDHFDAPPLEFDEVSARVDLDAALNTALAMQGMLLLAGLCAQRSEGNALALVLH